MSVAEFWEQTPRETYLAIEAALWRDERAQRQQMAQAWYTAALTRSKKLPTLKQLTGIETAKQLKGREFERRRQELKEMAAAVDISKVDLSQLRKTKEK